MKQAVCPPARSQARIAARRRWLLVLPRLGQPPPREADRPDSRTKLCESRAERRESRAGDVIRRFVFPADATTQGSWHSENVARWTHTLELIYTACVALDPDFVADCPYAPAALFIDEI